MHLCVCKKLNTASGCHTNSNTRLPVNPQSISSMQSRIITAFITVLNHCNITSIWHAIYIFYHNDNLVCISTNPACVIPFSPSPQTYFRRICVAQKRNLTWKPVNVCVGIKIKLRTAALIDISTSIPASAFATSHLLPPAHRTTSSIRIPVSARVARHVQDTSPSIKQSVPVNVTSHPISVS